MGYTTDSSYVRVDFFKPSGKWYTTEAVKWTGDYNADIVGSFAKSLYDHLITTDTSGKERLRLSGLVAVCLEPYHAYSFPLMLHVDRVLELSSR